MEFLPQIAQIYADLKPPNVVYWRKLIKKDFILICDVCVICGKYLFMNSLNRLSSYKICMNRKLYFKKVFLFGSIVQEKNRKYSDIDVALVSDQFTGNPIKDLQFIIPVLSSSPKFTLFEPHLYTPLDFKEDPFADVIKKTGNEIDIKK